MTRVLALGATVIALLALHAFLPEVRAQQPPTPYDLRPTPERVQRLLAAWNDRLSYVPGEVLVKFKPGTLLREQEGVLSLMRVPPSERQETWIGDVLVVRSADLVSDAVSRVLAQQPEVEWAQPNFVRRFNARPNDPGYGLQWNFDAIKMPEAWDINPGSTSTITVAVVDSGVTTTTETFVVPLWTGSQVESVPIATRVNPDIAAARIAPGFDFVFWDGPVVDLNGHGTLVSGTVLQETNNNVGLAGIAYRARLLPLKACYGYWELQIFVSAMGIPGFVNPDAGGDCPDAEVAQAIRYAADAGAQVINVSLGGPAPSPVLDNAIRYAVGRGSFVSVSGGNSFDEGNPVEYPAAYAASIDGAMSVAAVGRSNRRAAYSNTGAHIEITAPGGDFGDGGFSGLIFQAGLFAPDFDPFTVVRPRFDRYADVPAAGTSLSAPHIAGVAALLHSQGVNRAPAIEAALKRFATDLGASGRDNEFGVGLVDARATLRGLGVAR